MTQLTDDRFGEFFEALHRKKPFQWQQMLFDDVVHNGWPDLIDLPTAHGKTACIDVAIFALARMASSPEIPMPRRIWFVVDRRIVVDEAYQRAEDIAKKLTDAKGGILKHVADALRSLGGNQSAPLQVGRLRGGAPRKLAWAGNPVQPAVITSTVDQIGSRLLFRGYGLSPNALSIHAALAGNDSLILLDEAHLARPFYQTVSAVERFRGKPWATDPLPTPLKLVVMSATSPTEEGKSFRQFPAKEQREVAISDADLVKRRTAPKVTELVVAKRLKLPKDWKAISDDELVLDAAFRAAAFAAGGRKRVAVMVNRVRTAREIARELRASPVRDKVDVVLLTGRLRPLDRDALIARWSEVLKSGSKVDGKPVIVVTTQCLEVGADFSFDALISECASLDALRQRFGRLARLGEPADAPGAILIRRNDIRPKKPDRVYGDALEETWRWLTTSGRSTIKMGIDDLEPLLQDEDLARYRAPQLDAPILLPAYLDLLSQTGPLPAVEPDVALFLHGVPPAGQRTSADVRVLWRKELAESDQALWKASVEGLPPLSGEMLSLPIWELREALSGDGESHQANDLAEVYVPEDAPSRRDRTTKRSVHHFMIHRRGEVLGPFNDPVEIRPGDAVVLPEDSPLFRMLIGSGDVAQEQHVEKAIPPDAYELAYCLAHDVARIRVSIPKEEREREELEDLLQERAYDALDSLIKQLRDAAKEDDVKRQIQIEQLENTFKTQKPRPVEYAENRFHLTARMKRELIDVWTTEADDEEELLYVEGDHERKSLACHTKDVARDTRHLCKSLQLPEPFAQTLCLAAELHDIGKADPRFQHVLHRRPWREGSMLRAKSDLPRLAPARERLLRAAAGLPDGFRHEMVSLQIAARNSAEVDHQYRDLLLHLIASHHGHARPFAPLTLDHEPPDVLATLDGRSFSVSGAGRVATPPHRLDSGVAERFWSLTRQYGWWGFAYLEAVLRSADQHASALAEQEDVR